MTTYGGFPTAVNTQPAPAVEGDFCDSNPRFVYNAGPGGLVVGSAGLTAARFAWLQPGTPVDQNSAPTVVNNFGVGPPTGFVSRRQRGLITAYLAAYSMLTPQGFGEVLYTGGGFWMKNYGAGEALAGSKVFAELASGKPFFAAAGSVFGGASATGSSVAAATFSVTGSISGNLLTVTAVGAGTIVAGATISGTGITTGTQIASQITPLLGGEATGGIGRYAVTPGDQIVASTTVSGTYGILTIGTATGTFQVGDQLTGSGVVAGTAITQNITGSGGSGGTMVVNNNTVVASTTITASHAIETKWIAMNPGQQNELIKCTEPRTRVSVTVETPSPSAA